jgi:hypothetical protein
MRVKWVGYVAHRRDKKWIYTEFGFENFKERNHSKDVDVDGKITLKRDLNNEGKNVLFNITTLRLQVSIYHFKFLKLRIKMILIVTKLELARDQAHHCLYSEDLPKIRRSNSSVEATYIVS